jgi:hypothetical protein
VHEQVTQIVFLGWLVGSCGEPHQTISEYVNSKWIDSCK